MVGRSSIKVQSKDSWTGYKSTVLHTRAARYVIFDMQAARAVRKYSRSLVVRLRSAESIDSHRALATRRTRERTCRTGEDVITNTRSAQSLKSVRNIVEEKLTDDSLLRTWDGFIRKCTSPDRKFSSVVCIQHMNICIIVLRQSILPDITTAEYVCYSQDRKPPRVTHLPCSISPTDDF